MSNAAMKLNETSSDAYEKLEALLSPDVIKLKHYTYQIPEYLNKWLNCLSVRI